jgi:RNA polymerase sigma-70 factor (ECF subfamily)
VLQNIFIKAYRNIQSFDTKLSFSSWIYRIAHNETVSFFRSKKVRPEGNMIDDAEEFMEKIWDEHTDVAEEINQKINATHIIEALNSLEDKYKNILILRYFEDREYGEISDILQIPGGSVATLLHRAKKQLSKKLQHINN